MTKPLPTRTIELELDDVTVIDEWQKDEPTAEKRYAICGRCGKICELDGPWFMSGIPVAEWPCCRGKRWSYCVLDGRIWYDVR